MFVVCCLLLFVVCFLFVVCCLFVVLCLSCLFVVVCAVLVGCSSDLCVSMEGSEMLAFSLVELSGEEVVKGTWPAASRATCLYNAACLRRPGRVCRLIHGIHEAEPRTILASMDLSLGQSIQVIWLACNSTGPCFVHHSAFAAIKADDGVLRCS